MLKIDGCDLEVTGSVVLSFKVEAEELVRSLSIPEAKELVEAILGHHGTRAFEDISDQIVEEFAPKE